jgi:hypothetical protein
MDCRRAEELLSDHLEGQLGPPLLGELDGHLAACPQCRRLRASLQDVLEALDELRRSEVPAPAGLAARVAARTWGRRVRPARAPLSALQAAAVFLAVLALWSALGGLSPTAVRRFSARLLEQGSTTSAYLREGKERVEDEVRLLNVVVGTAFEDNLERVGQRVEDYRRLLGSRPGRAPEGAGGQKSRSGASEILSNRREARHVPRDGGQAASAARSLEGAGA